MSDPSIRHEHDSDEPAAAADDSVTVERDSSAGDVSLDGVDESLSPLHPAGGDDVPEVAEFSVESLLDDLERVTKERDGYLDDTRRVAADFANFRRQTEKRHSEVVEQAAAGLVERLLPVLDACDGALSHGAADVEPIYNMLIATLERSGLSVVRPLGEPFDPTCHDAVIHEEGEGDGPHVAEVLRTGYLWNGRVVRPALVKVRD